MRGRATRGHRRATWVAILSLTLASACNMVDSVKKGFEHSSAVSAQLEKAVGMKSFVGFNWHNGSLTSVTVQFDGLPTDHSLAEVAAASRSAVQKEFKQVPKRLIVSFAIDPRQENGAP